MSCTAHFAKLADYNAWANYTIYKAVSELSDDDRRRDTGLYFHSLHGTLAHLAATDNAWTSLLCGRPMTALPEEATATFGALTMTRAELDSKLTSLIHAMDEESLDDTLSYIPWRVDSEGMQYCEAKRDVLMYLFDHQAYHRSQAHAGLSRLGKDLPPLDLFAKQISEGDARLEA